MIYVGDISAQTRRAWEDFEDIGASIDNWLTLERACTLFCRLRCELDSAELFPKGKWASIQALEQQIIEGIENDKGKT